MGWIRVRVRISVRVRARISYRMFYIVFSVRASILLTNSSYPNTCNTTTSIERGLGIAEKAALEARFQAPTIFPHVQLRLWAKATRWECDAQNFCITIPPSSLT